MADDRIRDCTFTWLIENFSFCYQNTGEGLCSPSFSFGSSEKNWFLCLYPRGETEEKAEFIACYLHRAFIEECNIPFKFKFEIIGASGRKLKTVKGNYESPLLYRWGSSEFLEIQQLADDLGNNKEDVVTVLCRLTSLIPTKYPSTDCMERTKIDINRLIFKMTPFYEHGVINSREQITFPGGGSFECEISYIDDALEVKIVKLKSRAKICHFVEIKLTFQHGEGREIFSQAATHFFRSENLPETWYFPNFSSLVYGEEIMNSRAKNAATHLQWEFSISSGTKSNYMTNPIEPNDESSIDDNSWQKDMRTIFLNKSHSDVKLRVGNEVIDCHRAILAARSQVFSAMLGENTIVTRTYDIIDIDFDTLKLFLVFLYTDTVKDMDFEKAKKLLIAAEKYQVMLLKEKCFTLLSSEISTESVCDVLYAADLANHDRLKTTAMDFIVVNAADILPLPHWQEFMKNNTQLATEVLSVLTSNVSTFKNTKAGM